MKKVLISALAVCLFSLSAHAQNEIRLGGFLGYGSEVQQGGLGIMGEFIMSEKMAIAPNLLFYFPENGNTSKYSAWEINGNFHYYFLKEDVVSLYGLAGLNIITEKIKWDDHPVMGDRTDTDTGIGINLGAGCNFDIDEKIIPFTELRFTAGEVSQVVLSLGVKFPLQ